MIVYRTLKSLDQELKRNNMKENAFTHYNRDNTLYNRLIAAATDGKLPVLTSSIFEKMNAEYGKEKMRTHLADYIASERPVFPLKDCLLYTSPSPRDS